MFAKGKILEAENLMKEARDAHQMSLKVCQKTTPKHFKAGLGHQKVGTLFYKEGNFEEAL